MAAPFLGIVREETLALIRVCEAKLVKLIPQEFTLSIAGGWKNVNAVSANGGYYENKSTL